jgi:ComF family protein
VDRVHSLSKFFYSLLSLLKWLIAPAFCAHCRVFLESQAADQVFCARCVMRVTRVTSVMLSVTPDKAIQVFAATAYESPVRELVRAKHRSDKAAAKQLAYIVLKMLDVKSLDFDCIVPVPLHWRRYAHRGFNQAEVIAHVLGKYTDTPVLNALVRTRATALQASLEVHERRSNVHNVFDVKQSLKAALKNKRVLLVDDLLTTGATLSEAGRALLAVQPLSLDGLVVCRVI